MKKEVEYKNWLSRYTDETYKYYELKTELQEAQFNLELYKYDSNQRIDCICEHLGIKLMKSDGYKVEEVL